MSELRQSVRYCLVCGKSGFEGDMLWHVRQFHIVPALERPEDIENPDLRMVVDQWRREAHILVGAFKAPNPTEQ